MSANSSIRTSLSAFQIALEAERDYLNGRFRNRGKPGSVDGNCFLQELAQLAGPLVEIAVQEFPEKAGQVTKGLFDSLLDLHLSGHLGTQPKLALLRELWRHCFPKIPRLLARDPYRVSGGLSNALIRVAQHSAKAGDRWLTLMRSVGPRAEHVVQLFEMGLVAAWVSGLACYRDEALRKLAELPFAISRAILSWEDDVEPDALNRLLDRWASDPWAQPMAPLAERASNSSQRKLSVVGKLGGFRGFAGPFLYPPKVVVAANRLIALSGDTAWSLMADCFGTDAIRAALPSPTPGLASDKNRDSVSVANDGTIQWNELRVTVAQLAGVSSYACDGTTLAVTLSTSFQIFLLARCET